MHNPKISVVFPVYNNEKYIEKCIRSVMNQSFKDIEMIVIDDGSTDSAPAILDRLSEEDDRITVIHKENEGSAKGRNLGIENANGVYIAFVESDDYTHPDMYKELYDRAIKTDADIVKCGFYYVNDDLTRESEAFYRVAEDMEVFCAADRPEIFGCHASIWAGIYKKHFIESNHLRFIETPKATYSDFSWMSMTYAYANKITIIHRALYYYTYDNPLSSHFMYGNNYMYKMFHARKSLDILLKTGVYEKVKKYFNVSATGNCFDAAKRVVPENRENCFELIRDLCMYMYESDCDLVGLGNRRKLLCEYAINNDIDNFYNLLFTEFVVWDDSDICKKEIVLFGAGRCGMSFRAQIEKWQSKLVKWIDNNPNSVLGVEPVENIKDMKYDIILLAVVDEEIARQMKKQLLDMGVEEKSIIWKIPFRLV